MSQLDEIIADILTELVEAEAKHPVWPADPMYMDQIVNEEKGEVTRAVVQYVLEGGEREPIEMELVQTAATCIRMIKNLRA